MGNGQLSGIARIETALELAKESGDVEALGRAYTNLTHTYWQAGRLTDVISIAGEGSTAMRHAGAPSMGLFIAANAAASLLDLGRLEEVEELTSQILSEERAVLGAPGFVNAAISRVPALARLGRLGDARSLLDEVLPVARGVGGGQFLTALLAIEAELELGRGNVAPARQACQEAVAIGDLEQDFSFWYYLLPLAARLLEHEVAEVLAEQAETRAIFPALSAARIEARAILDRRTELFVDAAERYYAIPLPYQAARCLIEGGELARARELVDRYGLGGGPLGRALEQAERRD
jgi:hypothetical protein